MELNIFKTAAWQLVAQTDWMCKLVLMSLFLLSVYCVAVITLKLIMFRRQRLLMFTFMQRTKQARQLTDLIVIGKEMQECLGAKLLGHSFDELKRILEQNKSGEQAAVLLPHDVEYLELMVGQRVDALVLEEESYLPMLGSSAAVSPLIGLFGTIWGLIHAFIDISRERSADIATVAPGIAEALITTLAGLVVAIPAMIAFHYLSHELRKFEFQLVETGEHFIALAKYSLIKK
jgi:biopolymer transport protein TolQ